MYPTDFKISHTKIDIFWGGAALIRIYCISSSSALAAIVTATVLLLYGWVCIRLQKVSILLCWSLNVVDSLTQIFFWPFLLHHIFSIPVNVLRVNLVPLCSIESYGCAHRVNPSSPELVYNSASGCLFGF